MPDNEGGPTIVAFGRQGGDFDLGAPFLAGFARSGDFDVLSFLSAMSR
jgi:hypothetical protein